MQRKHPLLLACAVALMAACSQPNTEIEESPPPGASMGDEVPEPAPELAQPPAPEPPPPAAAPAEPPKPQPPTVGVVATLRVKDYDAWKQEFDSNEAERAQFGIVGHGVSVDADKKNTVVIYAGSHDLTQLKTYLDSDELKANMKEAGVKGKPKLTLMKHVDGRPAEGEVAATLMISHKVKDYAAWRPVYDSHAEARAEAGVIGDAVSQDPDDPNTVYVYLEGTDLEKLRAFTKDKGLKDAMKEAGVKGKPTFTFMEPKEMKLYPPDSVAKPAAAPPPPAPDESAKPAPAPAPGPSAAAPGKGGATPATPATPAKPAGGGTPATPAAPATPAKPPAK